MPGLSDYNAKNLLAWMAGQTAFPALPAVFAALFTAAPTSDVGTGGTEVSGGAYARQQIAGTLTLNGAFTGASTTLTLAATAPAWLLALGTGAGGNGCNVYDTTNGFQIGTVLSVSGTTVTLTTTAAHASAGAADVLSFSAFAPPAASSGTEPSVTPVSVTSGSQINFPQATVNWGTAIFLGLYDAVTSGNFLAGDYLGNFSWLPASVSSASPGLFTTHAHGYSANDPVVVTIKYGGTMPTFSQSNFTGVLSVNAAGLTTDAFSVNNAATNVNTSATGDLLVRKITQQQVPAGVAMNLPAGQVVAYSA